MQTLMHNDHMILQAAKRPIYRRSFTKRDGRNLYLYGYQPHELEPLSEEDFMPSKGGELRYHPLRREWNVYAPHRQNRTFKPSAADDPLAPSRSGGPPTEIPFEDFELAVFENKFTNFHERAEAPAQVDGCDTATAKGHCDVIVYGPESHGNLNRIGQDKRRLLIAAWNDRYDTLYSAGHKFVLPFENRGDEVGVTLHHPHGQIYAFPFIPNTQKAALNSFQDGYDLAAAIRGFKDKYEILSAGGLSAFCPPFARFPFEVWIAPETFAPCPRHFDETQSDGFAYLLGEITRRYDAYFERETAYMLSLQAAPLGHEDVFHFTAQFYPLLRSKTKAKFLASVEQSTGVFTVDVMPAQAAKTLRAL